MRRCSWIPRARKRRATSDERARARRGSSCALGARLLAGLASGCSPAAPADLGPAFEPDARVERVASGFVFTEGPLWDPAQGGLLFSELEHPFAGCGGRLLLWRAPDVVTTLRRPSCNANGLAFDLDGSLLSAEHGSRSITRCDDSFVVTETVAASCAGLPLNAPNDLVVRSDGTLYFSDPDFVAPPPPRRGSNALFRLPPQGGEPLLEALVDGPNGVALAPDERTLYVSDMHLGRVLAFAVRPAGELGPARVFAAPAPLADGLALDEQGNLFVATASAQVGAIRVFAPDGRALGSIAVPEPARSCAFGGADRRTLFVTAGGALYAVRLSVPGAARAGAGARAPVDEPSAPR